MSTARCELNLLSKIEVHFVLKALASVGVSICRTKFETEPFVSTKSELVY